ncbi:MAG: hypothetical protein R2710_16935 [Acidimicrobiales bacterium]
MSMREPTPDAAPGAALHHSTTRGPTVGDARPARAAPLVGRHSRGGAARIRRRPWFGILAKAIDAFLQLMLFTFVLAPVGALRLVLRRGDRPDGRPRLPLHLRLPGHRSVHVGPDAGQEDHGHPVVTTEGGPVQFRHAAVRSLIALIEFVLLPAGRWR